LCQFVFQKPAVGRKEYRMSEQKQDEVLYSQSQWMRPLQTAQLGNGVTPRKLSDAYATRYTPNEPDASEAAYAAQAQAARRRRHGAAPAQPQQPAGAVATPEPRPEPEARPDAVLYSSTTGIPPSAFADSEPGEGAAATGRRRRRMEQRREENPPLPQLQPGEKLHIIYHDRMVVSLNQI
jgi:nucleoid-associated protein YgaU